MKKNQWRSLPYSPEADITDPLPSPDILTEHITAAVRVKPKSVAKLIAELAAVDRFFTEDVVRHRVQTLVDQGRLILTLAGKIVVNA